jgi:hypothetical protein
MFSHSPLRSCRASQKQKAHHLLNNQISNAIMVGQTGRRGIFDLNDIPEELEQSPFENVQIEQERSSSDVRNEEQSNPDIENEEESQPPPSPQNLEEARVRIRELEAAIKVQAEDHDRAISREDTVEEENENLLERLRDVEADFMVLSEDTGRHLHRAVELVRERDQRIENLERENRRLRREIEALGAQGLSNNGFSQYPSSFWRHYDRRQVAAMREFKSQRD